MPVLCSPSKVVSTFSCCCLVLVVAVFVISCFNKKLAQQNTEKKFVLGSNQLENVRQINVPTVV